MKARYRFFLAACLLALPAVAAAESPKTGDEPPLSKDALFDLADDKPPTKPGGTPLVPANNTVLPDTKEALFGDLPAVGGKQEVEQGMMPPTKTKDTLFEVPVNAPLLKLSAEGGRWHGFFQGEAAYTYADPSHWSKTMGRLELGAQGKLGPGRQWKVSGRVDYNPVFDLNDHYQGRVAEDQLARFQLRETYLDFSVGDLDWRIGRQHVVWGEMVGLFFADVVSAKDLTEFILPDFQILRIPQWAARTEYFKDDFHAEVVWVPLPSYDELGKPKDFTRSGAGTDFYPYPPAFQPTILAEDTPSTKFGHTNFGVRLSTLSKGWDIAAFYYTSMNSAPTFYRTGVKTFMPRHDRIWQVGGTLGKDFRDFVLKAEAIYTNGRRYNLVTNLLDPDGVVPQDNLDWVVGLDFNPTPDTRVNTQVFQRYFFDHDSDIIPDKTENGVSLLINHKFSDAWTAEALLIHSLNRSDWLFRPSVFWSFLPNWKMNIGLDVFSGPVTGLFGQYDEQDRVYAEVRYDF